MTSFNRQKYEERVFWKSYCEIEKARDERAWGPNKSWRWLETLKEALLLQTEQKSPDKDLVIQRRAEDDEEEEFWLFYMDKTKYLCLSVLGVDLFFCLLALRRLQAMMQANAHVPMGDIASYMHLLSLFIYIALWLIYPAIGILLQICYIFRPSWLHKLALGNPRKLWDLLKYLVLASRAMLVMRNLLDMCFQVDSCYGMNIMSNLRESQLTVSYLVHIIVDVIQLTVLSLLPFSWQWVVCFSLLVYLDVLLRIYSCQDKLFGGTGLQTFVNAAMLNLAVTIFNVGIYSAYTFEHSMRASFQNISDQNSAKSEKINLVNMLCREIKAPAQHIVKSFEVFERLAANSHLRASKYADTSRAAARKINFMVDDMLFLVKVEEKRFHLSCSDVLDLQAVCKEVMDAYFSAGFMDAEEEGEETVEKKVLVDYDVPAGVIYSEKHCVRLLLFYGLTAMMQLFPTASTTARSCTVKIKKHDDSIKSLAKDLQTSHDCYKCIIRINKHIPFKMLGDSEIEDFEAACMVCQSIVDTYGGTFDVAERLLTFSFPSKREKGSLRVTLAQESNQNESIGSRAMRGFVAQNVMLYITDVAFQPMLVDSLKTFLRNEHPFIIHHSLNIALVKVYKIIVVQSIDACKEIRRLGFCGNIVLFSERLSYLDQQEQLEFSLGISLPPVASELAMLKSFFIQASNQEVAKTSPITEKHVVKKKNRNREYWNMLTNQCIATNRFESYSRWRIFLPSHRSFRYTLLLKMPSLAYAFVKILAHFMGLVGPRLMYGGFSYSIYALLRGALLKQVVTLFPTTSLARCWYLCGLMEMSTFILSGIYDNITLVRGAGSALHAKLIDYQYFRSLSVQELVHDKTRKIFGAELLYLPLYLPPVTKIFGDSPPWPLGPLCCFIQASRTIYIISKAYQYIMGSGMTMIVFWATCFIASLVLLIQYFTEKLWQLEFTELYKLTLSKDFLEKCIKTSRNHLLVSLLRLEVSHKQFLSKVAEEIKLNRLFVSSKFVEECEKLALQMMIANEISFELNLSDSAFLQDSISFMNSMRAEYVHKVVKDVSSCFLSSRRRNEEGGGIFHLCLLGNIAIKIHVQLDVSLAMVRVNEDLLAALLSKAVRGGIQNIQNMCQADHVQRDYAHELLIRIEPHKSKEVKKFTDVRFMQVIVLDSGKLKSIEKPEQQREVMATRGLLPRVKASRSSSRSSMSGASSTTSVSSAKEIHNVMLSRRKNKSGKVSFQAMHPVVERDNAEDFGLSSSTELGSITNKLLEHFGAEERFQAGAVLQHPRYHHYQKLYVPYLLCIDSHKYSRWNSNQDFFIQSVNRKNKIRQFKIYCNAYGLDVKDASRRHVAAKMQDTLMRLAKTQDILPSHKTTTRKQDRRSSTSRYKNLLSDDIFCTKRKLPCSIFMIHSTDGSNHYTKSIYQFFQQQGWEVTHRPPDVVGNNLSFLCTNYDALLVDIDALLLTWPHDLKDFIRYVRAIGFDGIIALSSKHGQDSPIGASVESRVWKETQRDLNNPFQSVEKDVETVLFCGYPLSKLDIQKIIKQAEKNILNFTLS